MQYDLPEFNNIKRICIYFTFDYNFIILYINCVLKDEPEWHGVEGDEIKVIYNLIQYDLQKFNNMKR